MILDCLADSALYEPLNPHFATAFAFLRRADLAQLAEGRHEVAGDAVYAVVAKGPGRNPRDARLETHDRYIDIQYVIKGIDTIGWKARQDLQHPVEEADPRNDVAFYADEPTAWSAIGPGALGIYFPQDAHMPMISDSHLHKVIMKVRTA